MIRRLLFVAGSLALVVVLGGPGQAHAQRSRGGIPHGMQRGFHHGFTPGFRGPVIDPRFVPRRSDRFEDRFENRFGRFDRFEDRFENRSGRFDRFEDRLENRVRFGLLPHFLGGFVPGFPGMAPFGFSPFFVPGF